MTRSSNHHAAHETDLIRLGISTSSSIHAVQFYEEDDALLDRLADFFGAAIGAGRASIVIATPTHRSGLLRRLQRRGIDTKDVEISGRFVLLDAADTLERISIDGKPDRVLFFDIVGSLMSRVQQHSLESSRSLALFGEMVALIWAEGKFGEAILLEQLWNELAEEHAFALLCAYPIVGFDHEEGDVYFSRICAEHSQLFPCESYSCLREESQRIQSICQLQQKASSLSAEVARRKKAETMLHEIESLAQSLIEDSAGTVPAFEVRIPLMAAADLVGLAQTSEHRTNEIRSHLDGIQNELSKIEMLLSGALAHSAARWRN